MGVWYDFGGATGLPQRSVLRIALFESPQLAQAAKSERESTRYQKRGGGEIYTIYRARAGSGP